MKLVDWHTLPKIRRKAAEKLTVYDLNTQEPMGLVMDMSERGMKLRGDVPANVSEMFYLRVPLKKKIDGRKELFFDAECRWCRKFEETGRYYSGYLLRFPTKKDAEIVRKLIHNWMANYNDDLNSRY